MCVRLAAAFVAIVVLTCHAPLYAPLVGELPTTAHAESNVHSKVQKLIDDLRGTSMPEGIAKTNGRIEATQIDVSAKYAGRLATVTVKEGDEVTAGQVLARISSPEYEAQLRGAQSQVLKAKQGLAEAEGADCRSARVITFAKTDVERGQPLVEEGMPEQASVRSARRQGRGRGAALRAAEAEREAAQFAIKSAQADVERIDAILVDLTLLSPRSGRVQYQIAPRRRGRRGRHAHPHDPRSQRRLHDDLPAGRAGRAARTRRRGPHDPRSVSAICGSGDHKLRRDRCPVHAEKRRDGRGAREADLPRQAAGRSARC